MILVTVKFDLVVDIPYLPIHTHAHKTGLSHILKYPVVVSLSILYERGKDLYTTTLWKPNQGFDYLFGTFSCQYKPHIELMLTSIVMCNLRVCIDE